MWGFLSCLLIWGLLLFSYHVLYREGLRATGRPVFFGTGAFTAIVGLGQFFYRSLYGYMDHHIAEVLFSTLFCLLYMYVLLFHWEQNKN